MNLERTAKAIQETFLPNLHTLLRKKGIQTSGGKVSTYDLPNPYIVCELSVMGDSLYTLTLRLDPPKDCHHPSTYKVHAEWLEPLLGVSWTSLRIPCPSFLVPTDLRAICSLILLEWNRQQHDLYVWNGPLPGEVLRDTKDIKEAL